MFCALLTSRYQVSVYRTNGPLVIQFSCKQDAEQFSLTHSTVQIVSWFVAYIVGRPVMKTF